jgi:D-proline reductase (dithiol) PrdB
MAVDSYAFLPRAFRPIYEAVPPSELDPAWAPFEKPLGQAKIALLSSAGMFLRSEQEPFDVERERQEPTWGDPSFRIIPAGVTQPEIDATHLHINTADLLTDLNIALPLQRLQELAEAGAIGAMAEEHYSLMGYQEEGAEVWRTRTGPEIAARCHAADIDALILAPA